MGQALRRGAQDTCGRGTEREINTQLVRSGGISVLCLLMTLISAFTDWLWGHALYPGFLPGLSQEYVQELYEDLVFVVSFGG